MRLVKLEVEVELPKIGDRFELTNNHEGKDIITKRYIRMGPNCSPKLPEDCMMPTADQPLPHRFHWQAAMLPLIYLLILLLWVMATTMTTTMPET